MRRLLGFLIGAVSMAAGTGIAAVDPDLVVLDAKVTAEGASIQALDTKVGVVAAQLQQQFAENEAALLQLGDARKRDIEEILLDCALDPAQCKPPSYLVSALDPMCTVVAPLRGRNQESAQPHTHDAGAACPLQELLGVVRADLDAIEAAGLVRDFVSARGHLDAADAARLAGDGWTAFQEACAAFRFLACPGAR